MYYFIIVYITATLQASGGESVPILKKRSEFRHLLSNWVRAMDNHFADVQFGFVDITLSRVIQRYLTCLV